MTEPNVTVDGQAPGAVPARSLTDIEVAQFLADFRGRPQEQQESSPVYQELVGFPQWAGAQYKSDDDKPTLEPPPDPRLPALERRETLAEQQAGQPQPVQVTQQPSGARAMTTADVGTDTNPWADYNPPADDGSGAWMPVNTDVRPPYPGDWQRRQGGWWRTPTE